MFHENGQSCRVAYAVCFTKHVEDFIKMIKASVGKDIYWTETTRRRYDDRYILLNCLLGYLYRSMIYKNDSSIDKTHSSYFSL